MVQRPQRAAGADSEAGADTLIGLGDNVQDARPYRPGAYIGCKPGE